MYVCICRGVSQSDVRALLEGGVRGVEAVQKACGAGTDCGSCQDRLETFVETEGSNGNQASLESICCAK